MQIRYSFARATFFFIYTPRARQRPVYVPFIFTRALTYENFFQTWRAFVDKVYLFIYFMFQMWRASSTLRATRAKIGLTTPRGVRARLRTASSTRPRCSGTLLAWYVCIYIMYIYNKLYITYIISYI